MFSHIRFCLIAEPRALAKPKQPDRSGAKAVANPENRKRENFEKSFIALAC